MPLYGIPAKDYLDREDELAYLKRLASLRRDTLADNVLLIGPRGIGKTEFLKQLYRSLFWDSKDVVPFYYSFKTAALKSTTFARDYFARFVKQYVAFVKKEPLHVNNMSMPLPRLIPLISNLGLDWLIDCIDDFQQNTDQGDLYGQLLSAISTPVNAAVRGGLPVLVMLDDFTASEELHETKRGDAPGLTSLFEESMKNSLCPHIITGSPSAKLEAIFSDPALHKGTERMRLYPLPEDAAYALFSSLLAKMKISFDREAALDIIRRVKGSPLYIRNMARAAWKMKKNNLDKKDFSECYSFEIIEGETAFYWSSVFSESLRDKGIRRTILELLMHRIARGETGDQERLSKVLGVREPRLSEALDALELNDFGGSDDLLLKDFVQSLYFREVEGKTGAEIRKLIEAKYDVPADSSVFEMVIPMSDQAELVAARAVDQIGKNINLEPELMNYLQLALVESCINAMEHSGSYEKKIYLKFTTTPERLEIAIESPGRHFTLDSLKESATEEKMAAGQKRGWGFVLMRKIMDEVRVERISDRTRVTLIKNIKRNEVLK
ncbi:MAG TPA: ATP-binding protein [Candidatus Sulfobium mesophilum]|nr:ATP-binding protein [Candidatus Sulfobium mesophilum]